MRLKNTTEILNRKTGCRGRGRKPDNYDEINSAKFLTPVLGLELYISERYQQRQFTKDDPDRRTQVVLLAKILKDIKIWQSFHL